MWLLLLLASCDRPARGYLASSVELSWSATTLEFGVVALGSNNTLPLTVSNVGTAEIGLVASVDMPFTLESADVRVGPGASVDLVVRYAATSYAPAAGTLTITPEGLEPVTIPVSATTNPDSDGDGIDAMEAGGTDCDDRAAATYPGAVDACYDGVDQDCDGISGPDPEENDCDGDASTLPADCDDQDPMVHPGAVEVDDDADQDCDGLRDEDFRVLGEIVLAEILPGGGGWVELCNVSPESIPVDGFTVGYTAGSVTLGAFDLAAGACVAVCERASDDCQLTGGFGIDAGRDDISVLAGATLLDLVALDPSWGWSADGPWSVDPASLSEPGNDDRVAWCQTIGSPGTQNPDCP